MLGKVLGHVRMPSIKLHDRLASWNCTVSVKADSNRELAGLHDSSLKLVPSALCPAKGTMLGHTEECVQGSNTVTPTARFSAIITHFSNTVTRGLVALKHSA